jgi:hypothetical protein
MRISLQVRHFLHGALQRLPASCFCELQVYLLPLCLKHQLATIDSSDSETAGTVYSMWSDCILQGEKKSAGRFPAHAPYASDLD